MEIWLDTADLTTIGQAEELGILHGITTNPTLVSKSGLSLEDLLDKLLDSQNGPVAVQVVGDRSSDIINQAELLTAHSPRVIVKVPLTIEGLKTIRRLTEKNIAVMATAIFEPYQALLAFKAGAHYLAPYLGRIKDFGLNPHEVLASMQELQENYNFQGKIIAAGIRDLDTFMFCALYGVAAATLNEENFKELLEKHDGTEKAVSRFREDWKEAKESRIFS